MNDSSVETFFHYFSKIVIIIPIIIIIVGLIFKYNHQEETIKKKNIITPTAIIKQPIATSSAQFNFQGPLICNFSSPTATISGYIKEKKISAVIVSKKKITNFIYRDDCLYIWDKGSYLGQKVCGLTSYFSIFDIFSKLNILGSNNLISFLSPLVKDFDIALDETEIKNIFNYCKQKEINDLTVFNIPQMILFKKEN